MVVRLDDLALAPRTTLLYVAWLGTLVADRSRDLRAWSWAILPIAFIAATAPVTKFVRWALPSVDPNRHIWEEAAMGMKDWKTWLAQIGAKGATRAQLTQKPGFRALSPSDQEQVLRAFDEAKFIDGERTKAGFHAPKPMRYDSQVIIVMDPDLLETARLIQTKRDLADESGKSYVLDCTAGRGRLEPALPAGVDHPPLSENSRVYVLAHGNPGSTVISERHHLSAEKLATFLKGVLGNWDTPKVQRVSLLTCFAGGNPNGLQQGPKETKVPATESFARHFFEKMKDATSEVSARTDEVNPQGLPWGAENPQIIGVRITTGEEQAYKAPGRKVAFSQNDAGHTVYVVEYETTTDAI